MRPDEDRRQRQRKFGRTTPPPHCISLRHPPVHLALVEGLPNFGEWRFMGGAVFADRARRWAVYPAPISVIGVSPEECIMAPHAARARGWIIVRVSRDTDGASQIANGKLR